MPAIRAATVSIVPATRTMQPYPMTRAQYTVISDMV